MRYKVLVTLNFYLVELFINILINCVSVYIFRDICIVENKRKKTIYFQLFFQFFVFKLNEYDFKIFNVNLFGTSLIIFNICGRFIYFCCKKSQNL